MEKEDNKMAITIGKALRLKKTIIQNISQAIQRAKSSAVTYGDKKPDFNVSDQLERYISSQNELRNIKINVIKKSVEVMVPIPKNTPVPEAGTSVPAYQAILIRDDLKGQRSFLNDLINMRVVDEKEYDMESNKYITVPAVRNFDFEDVLEQTESLQDYIDEIDAAIQYTDAVETIDI